MIAEAKSNIESLEKSIESANKSIDKWNNDYGRDLVILLEYLEREESIYTAPTLMAVSNQAFVLDGWIPSSDKERVQKALAEVASHISIEKHVEDHHHHDDHHEEAGHVKQVPKELQMLSDYLELKEVNSFRILSSMDLDDSGELEFP